LQRETNNSLAQRNGTNPQTLFLFNTYSNSTNYERGFLRWTNNAFQFGTSADGSGQARDVQILPNNAITTTFGGSGISLTAAYKVTWTGRSIVSSPTDGNLLIQNNAQASFDRLQFGGTNNTFPALKRTNTVLQVRLADDSAYTTIDAQHRLQGTAPTNSTDTGTAGDIRYDTNNYIYICVSSNTWRRTSLTNW
jgi:hypothetical protein